MFLTPSIATSGPQGWKTSTKQKYHKYQTPTIGSVNRLRNHGTREEDVCPGALHVPPPFMPVLSFSSLFFAHRRTATATCLGSLSGLFYFKSDLNPESLRSFFRVEKWRSLVQLQSPDLLRPPSPAFHLLLGS